MFGAPAIEVLCSTFQMEKIPQDSPHSRRNFTLQTGQAEGEGVTSMAQSLAGSMASIFPPPPRLKQVGNPDQRSAIRKT